MLKEFKLDNAADLNVGDEVKATVFAAGDRWTSLASAKVRATRRHQAPLAPTRLKETHGTGPVHRHARFYGLQHRSLPYFQG